MIEAAPVTPDFASLHPGYTFAKWVCAKNKAGSTTCLSSLSALALNVTVAWHSSGAQAPSPRPSPQWREGDEGRAAGTMSFVLPHANGGGGPSEAAQQRRMVEGAFVVRLNNPSTTCIRRSSRPTHRTRAQSPLPAIAGRDANTHWPGHHAPLSRNQRSGRTPPDWRAANGNYSPDESGRRNLSKPRKTASAPAACSRTARQCDACAPGFLRAGVEPVPARQIHQRMNVAAEIGPLAGAEPAIDGDEQCNRRVEEFVIALVLGQPRRDIVAVDLERAVKLHAMMVAPRLVRLHIVFG